MLHNKKTALSNDRVFYLRKFLIHLVQILSFLPSTVLVCKFIFTSRLVLIWEWLFCWPEVVPRLQI
ncbi:MAG: hypothetical protein AUJ28_02550 [Parcubacteria group bacterium CG1_02_37_51]|nr:MAG: hypothetical protein AUJ28_02550 [Parcubacteria group bacterium CG1_02_37_51]